MKLAQMQDAYRKLVSEVETFQAKMDAGPLSQTDGEAANAKVQEAEALDKEIKAAEAMDRVVARGREIPNPVHPASKEQKEQANQKRIQTTPGALFVLSEAYKGYRDSGKQGWSAKVDIKSVKGGRVVLEGEAATEFEQKAFNSNQLSDLGDDAVIQPLRDNDFVRYAEAERRTLRNLLSVVPVNTDSVRYVKHTATARAAESQATRGAAKPYLTVTFAPETVNVETIAVLSKVTEQDIDDAPRLVALINDEMRLDVEVEEERQLAWGSGATGEIEGFFTQGITEFDRAVGGDTLIDTIRRMRTDLVMARVMPDGVAAHPLDWEDIELEKGSDSRYVWAVIQTVQGARIWSMPVVETMGMENPLTGERRLTVADWKRGATLYDRHDVRLAIGFVDDDFARNLRTLRAEERLALAVKRAYAMEYTVTGEAS